MTLQEAKKEQAFYNIEYNETSEIDELRQRIVDYLECETGELGKKNLESLMQYADLKKCGICGHIDLEESMHENTDGIYCDTCWDASIDEM